MGVGAGACLQDPAQFFADPPLCDTKWKSSKQSIFASRHILGSCYSWWICPSISLWLQNNDRRELHNRTEWNNCSKSFLRPAHTRELAPETCSRNMLPGQSSLVCTNDFMRKFALLNQTEGASSRSKSVAGARSPVCTNMAKWPRSVLLEHVSGASSLVCASVLGWPSGESAGLSLLWPLFNPWISWGHKWTLSLFQMLFSLSCHKRFLSSLHCSRFMSNGMSRKTSAMEGNFSLSPAVFLPHQKLMHMQRNECEKSPQLAMHLCYLFFRSIAIKKFNIWLIFFFFCYQGIQVPTW